MVIKIFEGKIIVECNYAMMKGGPINQSKNTMPPDTHLIYFDSDIKEETYSGVVCIFMLYFLYKGDIKGKATSWQVPAYNVEFLCDKF